MLNALNPSTKFIQRGFYERNGLDGTIKLGVQKKEGTKNYFIIDGDEFEPAYNGDNTPYHMYFQRKDEYVGFAGKLTDVLNPKRPAAQDRSESTLMDDIWRARRSRTVPPSSRRCRRSRRPIKTRGCFPVVIVRWFCLPPLAPR